MSIEDGGGPAAPVYAQALENGLTIRDFFAGQALQGILALNLSSKGLKVAEIPDRLAGTAFRLADAMLRARAR